MTTISSGSRQSPRAPSPSSAASSTGSSSQRATVDYRVKSGDTLSSIAATHESDVDALARLNPQLSSPDELRAGATIRVPAADREAAVDAKPTAPAARREPVPAGVQQGARRGAAAREETARAQAVRSPPKSGAGSTTARPVTRAFERKAGASRQVGDATAAAAVDGARGQFGRVEGQNKPWSAEGSVDRTGARYKGGFSEEHNAPTLVAELRSRVGEGRLTRAAGTVRQSGSVDAAVGLRDGVKASVSYNNQVIAWGYKFVGRANLPLGFSGEGKSKVASGTYVDLGAESTLQLNQKRPSAYLKAQATGFAGARNLSEGTITSPRGVLTASGHASVEGGGGASLGAEAGIREGKVVLGANVGAKVGWGLELGGRLELDLPKLFDVVREAGGHGLRQLQQQPPGRLAVQGWFR